MTPSTLVVAHRGASAEAPENTLAAFKLAAEQGASMIELDVQVTGDEQLVVFHDDTLERCTDAAERLPDELETPIFKLSVKQLGELQANRPIAGYAPSEDTRIPTLAAVFDWLEGEPEMLLNVEIKALPRREMALTPLVAALIQHRNMGERVIVSSFDHEALKLHKSLLPDVKTAVLSHAALVDMARYAKDYVGADAINPGAHLLGSQARGWLEGRHLDGQLLETARELGLESYVWTVNDPQMGRALASLGATGVITDVPARLKAVL